VGRGRGRAAEGGRGPGGGGSEGRAGGGGSAGSTVGDGEGQRASKRRGKGGGRMPSGRGDGRRGQEGTAVRARRSTERRALEVGRQRRRRGDRVTVPTACRRPNVASNRRLRLASLPARRSRRFLRCNLEPVTPKWWRIARSPGHLTHANGPGGPGRVLLAVAAPADRALVIAHVGARRRPRRFRRRPRCCAGGCHPPRRAL